MSLIQFPNQRCLVSLTEFLLLEFLELGNMTFQKALGTWNQMLYLPNEEYDIKRNLMVLHHIILNMISKHVCILYLLCSVQYSLC